MSDTRSAVGRRARNRGHETENMAVRYLRDAGFVDAETTRKRMGSDGSHQPIGDVVGIPGAALEVKGVAPADARWHGWLRALTAECPPGVAPVVLLRIPRLPVGQWVAAVPWRYVRPFAGTAVMHTYEHCAYHKAIANAEMEPPADGPLLIRHAPPSGLSVAAGRFVDVLDAIR